MSPLITALLAVLVPIAAGWLAKEVALLNDKINSLGAPFPALIGIGVAYVLSEVSQKLGITLPGGLAGLDQNAISALLMAAVAYFTHQSVAFKAKRASRGLKR